jgi:ABC-2 type transport system permease protein
MRPSVTLQTVHTQRRSLLSWSIAISALIAMYVAVWPSVKGTGSSFSKLIDTMPAAYKALFTTGSGIDFSTPVGYLNVELFSFMGPLVVLAYTIGAGASAIAGEEDRRTLDLLLVNSISRSRVVVEKMAAIVLGTTVLVTVMWAALLVEGRIASMDIPVADSAAALIHLGLLGLEFGALALLIGAWTGRVGLSRAVAAIAAGASYVVNGLATLVGWLEPVREFSPFYQYSGHDPLRNGFSSLAIAVSVASTVVLVLASVRAFRRRDVAT